MARPSTGKRDRLKSSDYNNGRWELLGAVKNSLPVRNFKALPNWALRLVLPICEEDSGEIV